MKRAKQVYSLSCLGKFDEAYLPVEKASYTLRIVLKVFFVNKYNMDYNYIEIPKSNFPTLCSDYPEDAKIEVRMFTVADIKLISRVNEFNLKYIIDELLHRCCRFTNMTYDDLYIADRDYILMFLKSGSFITANGFDIKLDKCAHCNEPITISLAIKDLELDVCTETRKIINVNGIEIKCQLPKVGQKLVKFKDIELEKIINYTNLAEIFGGVNEAISTILAWNAYDYVQLANAVNEMKCGLKEELEIGLELLDNLPHGIFNLKEALLHASKIPNKEKILAYILRYTGITEQFIKDIAMSDLNVSRAAKEMFIHRNTMIYKLDKLNEVSGFDLRCFKDAYILYMLVESK